MPLDPSHPVNRVTEAIIACAIDVHEELGPGLLESAYKACLEHELIERRVRFRREVAVPLTYRGLRIPCGYRVDILVEDCVIVEVKSVQAVAPVHVAQMITYLKLTRCPVGWLLNFNRTSMRQGIRRVDNRFLVGGEPHDGRVPK